MKREVKIGLATALILCVWLFGGFFLAGTLHLGRLNNLRAVMGLLGLVILFAGVFFGIRKVKGENGFLTYGQAFRTGVIISLTVALIVSLAGGLHSLLHPEFQNDMIREAEQALRESNITPGEIANKLDSVRREYSLGAQFMQPLIGQSVAGIIFSSIISYFLKTKKIVL